MWLRLQIVVLVLMLCGMRCLHTQAIRAEDDLELLFSARSPVDWQNVWHRETHSRCRHKLIRHLFWACENDIYRITRRNGGKRNNHNGNTNNYNHIHNSDNDETNNNNRNDVQNDLDESWHKAYKFNTSPTWLRAHHAYILLRTRRRVAHASAATAPSITSECCTKNGCTWEEYAEYCPSNKRRTHY